MPEKKISVIIPFYNSRATLKDCLESIFNNSYKNFEVILVNDCSNDSSLSVVELYDCKSIDLSERRGPAYARNKGLSLATGEIVAFLDSDCTVPKDWLATINSKLTKDIIGIGGRYDLPNDIGKLNYLFMSYWDPKNIFYRHPVELISLSGGNCAFWRKHLLEERPKKELAYCNKRVGGDDTIMCYELGKLGKIIYDPDIHVLHNKRCSLLHILKETISLGYSGGIVTSICGISLIKEPHRFYKAITYVFSLSIVTASVFLAWKIIALLTVCYVAIQLPCMFLLKKRIRPLILTSYPFVTLTSDILNLAGNLIRIFDVLKKALGSLWWHIKLLVNAINPSALSKIFLFVTKRCNANCYFCFNKQDGSSEKKDELSFENIKRIASTISFLPLLTITGGEPFLRNDIDKICRTFYHNCGTRNITIVTNGYFISRIEDTVEKILIDCPGIFLTVIVALDNIGEKHDVIKGIKGLYEKAVTSFQRLRLLKSRFKNLTCGVNTVIIKENSIDIEKILEYFSNNIKHDRQCLNILRQKPSSSIEPENISIEAYLSLVKMRTFQDNGHSSKNTLKQTFHRAVVETFCDRSLKEFKEKKALKSCLAARKFFVIDNDTAIYPCEILQERLGDLKAEDYDFRKVQASLRVKDIRSRIDSSRCYCKWGCAVAFNGYFDISSYPKIILKTLAILKDNYYAKKTTR